MPSGGARVRSGPKPDRGALRRNRPSDRAGWVMLPSAGREGPPPAWPLSRASKFELEQWESHWRKPQAVMWERLGLDVQVALYIRTLREASRPGTAAARTTALLRQIDSLGLSAAGLAAQRWVIEDAAPAADSVPRRPAGASAKDRMRVISGGTDARAS